MTDDLSVEDALVIADEMRFVVRDPGLLAAAVARPAASAFGADAYTTLPVKIAALIDGVNRNHPLLDGNKRFSWVCAVVYASINGEYLAAPQKEIHQMVLRVAEGRTTLDELADWIDGHLEPSGTST